MKGSINEPGSELLDGSNGSSGQIAYLTVVAAMILSSCAVNVGNVLAGRKPILRESAAENVANRRGQDAGSDVDDELKKQRLAVALTAFRTRISDGDLKKIPMDRIIREAMKNGRFGGRAEYNINNVRVVVYYNGAPADCRGNSSECERKYKVPDFRHLEIVFVFEFNERIYEFHFHRSRMGDKGTNFDSDDYSYQVLELYHGMKNKFGNLIASDLLGVPEDHISDKCLEDCIIQQCRDDASSITCKEGCIQKAYDERPGRKFRDKMPPMLGWLYEHCRGVLARAF